jgi:hypothetical protein
LTAAAGSAVLVAAQWSLVAAQGALDSASNFCGAVTAFGAGPLLVVTGFAVLSLLALAALLPLSVLLVTRSVRRDRRI